jgi:uncharacterized protein YjdB
MRVAVVPRRSRGLWSALCPLIVLTSLSLSACSGGAGDNPPVAPPPVDAVTAVSVTPSSAALVVGATVALVPNATTAGAGVVVNYTYVSSAPDVATVNASGTVTAVREGSANITVTATGSGGGFATSTRQAVATMAVAAPPAALAGLTVTPDSVALFTGATTTLNASATPRGAGVSVVYGYTSSAPNIASVDNRGVVSAVSPGMATITIIATGTGSGFAETSLQARTVVQVTAPPPAISALTVSPDGAALVTGDSVRLTPATTTAAEGVRVVYAYTSSAPNVASVDSRGVVSAVSPGTATITVIATGTGSGFAETSLQARAMVLVTAPLPALTSLTVSPSSAAIAAGDTLRIEAALITASAAVRVVFDYSSSAPGVASVDDRGVIRAVSAGTATITVRATGSGTGFTTTSREATVGVTVTAPAVPQWQRVSGHPGESWAARWGDWTVAAGRLWVVENERLSMDAPRIHHSVDGVNWQTLNAQTLGLPSLQIGADNWGGNTTLLSGTESEVVIATTLVAPLTSEGNSLHRTQPWVLRGTLDNWTVQGATTTPGLNPRQIPNAGDLQFSASAMTGASASWGDRVVLLPRGIWWRPGATTDQSFLSLSTGASRDWQLFAQRGYPWGDESFQWMTGAAGTPWGFFAVGHVAFRTAFWYSADGYRWDVVPDPVSNFGGSRNRSAQVWSGAMMYGAHGLVMARVRDAATAQIVAWRSTDGQQWQESVIADAAYGDVQGFATSSHYVVAAPQTAQGSDRLLRHVWVSRDAQRWVRIPEGPTFTKIIGLGSRLWGFRNGEVWALDVSGVGGDGRPSLRK